MEDIESGPYVSKLQIVDDSVKNKIVLISSNTLAIQNLASSVGTIKDSAVSRTELKQLSDSTWELIKAANKDIKELGNNGFQQSRLFRDFYTVVKQYQMARDAAVSKEQELSDPTPLELYKLEAAMAEINGIFRDIGRLVGEQDSHLDNIEANLGFVAAYSRDATQELVRSEKRQRTRKQWTLWAILLLAGSLIVLELCR